MTAIKDLTNKLDNLIGETNSIEVPVNSDIITLHSYHPKMEEIFDFDVVAGCYLHGKLEGDFMYDVFAIKKGIIPDQGSGAFKFIANGKPCTLLRWETKEIYFKHWRGLAFYDDDLDAKSYAIKMYDSRAQML